MCSLLKLYPKYLKLSAVMTNSNQIAGLSRKLLLSPYVFSSVAHPMKFKRLKGARNGTDLMWLVMMHNVPVTSPAGFVL